MNDIPAMLSRAMVADAPFAVPLNIIVHASEDAALIFTEGCLLDRGKGGSYQTSTAKGIPFSTLRGGGSGSSDCLLNLAG